MKKKKRLSGIERRWFVNNVGVIMLLVLACVLGVVLYMAAYYDTNLRSGLENRAKTTTDFFSNYIGQSYNEYYQSCIKFAKTFEDKDRLELQFISPGGKIVASSYGKFAGRSPSTPEIQQAIDSQQTRHYKGRNPLTGERILAVSSPMIYTNGEVIGVLRYVTGLKNVDRQILMIGLIALTAGLIFIASMFFISSFFIRSIIEPVTEITATGVPRESNDETRSFDPAVYSQQVFGMFRGEQCRMKLRFENSLAALPCLTAFIPMLMDTGGNSGSQACVSIIRGISLNEIEFRDLGRVVWKEIRVSVLCGVCLAVACFAKIIVVDMLLLKSESVTYLVAFVVCATMAVTVCLAKIVGSTLPLLAKKLGFDPAVMASPIITTIVDFLSLLVYFAFATAILGIG